MPNAGQIARSEAAARSRRFKCAKADFYRGLKPPKCNGGEPCDTCKATYEKTQAKGAVRNIVTRK